MTITNKINNFKCSEAESLVIYNFFHILIDKIKYFQNVFAIIIAIKYYLMEKY